VQRADALGDADPGRPAGRVAESSRVADVVPLICLAPGVELHLRRRGAQRADRLDQLDEAGGSFRPAADVERVAGERVHLRLREQHRIDEIADVQDVADLQSVAVYRDRLILDGANEKVRDPALILGAELVRTVNAAHSEDDRRQPEGARVVEDVLVRGALRTAIRAVKIDRARFADARHPRVGVRWDVTAFVGHELHVFQVAVHLVRRREQERWRFGQRAQRLQEVQRAAGVHHEIEYGIGEARRDGHLRGEVIDLRHAVDRARHGGAIADVAVHDVHAAGKRVAQPAKVRVDAGAREVVEHADGAAAFEQPCGDVGADEPGATRHERRLTGGQPPAGAAPHTVNPRMLSSALASATRSNASWPLNQLASSSSPASNSMCGL
jgi:hypothetical protein